MATSAETPTSASERATTVTAVVRVQYGHQAVYRHDRNVAARVGRWRITAQARILRTAQVGVYPFEGKVVVGQAATWRIFTLRVVG